MASGRHRLIRKITQRWSRLHPWLVPAMIFASFLFAYLSTLTRLYTYDSVAYATQIRSFSETGRIGWLFHPHHLLYNPLGLLAWRVLTGMGARVDSLLALQYLNAFAGAMGLVIFYEMLGRGGLRLISPSVLWARGEVMPYPPDAQAGKRGAVWPPLAFAATVLLGSSFGYWTCATDGRVNMPDLVAVVTFCGLAWGMVSAPTTTQAFAMGMVTVIAVGLHQSSGLLIPAGLVAVIASRGWPRKKLRLGLVYLLVAGVGIAGLYAGIGFLAKDARTLEDIQDWALAYARDGRWWSFDIRNNLLLDMEALAHVFLPSDTGLFTLATRVMLPLGGALLAAGLLAGVLPRSVRRRAPESRERSVRRGTGSRSRRIAVLATAALAYAAFFTVWVPGYFAFWVPVGAMLVAAFAVMFAGRTVAAQAVAAMLLLVLAGAVLRINVPTAVVPRTLQSSNLDLALSEDLGRHIGKGDLVLTMGVPSAATPAYAEVYVPYFTRASLRALSVDLKAAGGDVPKVVHETRGIVCNRIGQGGRIVVMADFYSPDARTKLAKRYKAGDTAPERILQGYRLAPITGRTGVVAYRVVDAPACEAIALAGP